MNALYIAGDQARVCGSSRTCLHVVGKVLQKVTVCGSRLGHDLDTIFASNFNAGWI
jgi:hypothetical protein